MSALSALSAGYEVYVATEASASGSLESHTTAMHRMIQAGCMLRKTLFVALNRMVAPASEIAPFVADHLAYMNKLEAEGHLWASGPFIEEGVLVGDGLTILSTPTIEEAERVMKDEPLIKRGLRKFELRKWELREGRMTITLNASTSKYSL
jgi:uncharacterized protein